MWFSSLDSELFFFINTSLSNSVLDLMMPWFRQPYFWLPLYIFYIAFVLLNFGRRGYWLLLFTILTVSTSDYTSSRIVKPFFQRIRPCNEQVMPVIERVPCGAGFSFTSSHAANHYSLAVFFILTLGRSVRRAAPWLLSWATLVGLAQIYVGVHYPGDIFGGALLGTLLGVFWAWLFRRFYSHTLITPIPASHG